MLCAYFASSAFAPPAPLVPDSQGGFVPFTNARVLPDGSLRPYDPVLDGIMGPDGRMYFLPPPPDPYPPPGRVTVGPPRVCQLRPPASLATPQSRRAKPRALDRATARAALRSIRRRQTAEHRVRRRSRADRRQTQTMRGHSDGHLEKYPPMV
jgi:hypothetical protein